jgi:hypothetical protein
MTKLLVDGLKNCRPWSGYYEPSPVATLAPPHTSWSTAQKQYSLWISLFRSSCVEDYDEDKSDEARELEVNCSEERHLDSFIRIAKYLAILH